MKFFSMFSGIGGFDLALNRLDHQCVGFSEIDKYAIQIYNEHFKGVINYGDATKIEPRELPEFELLCGGFPCQAFSIAGKRMGFEDTRGTLFFEIARIIKERRPQIVFLENVKGLLNHDNGRTFATILATFDELGYNAEWQVLNSKHFGVPQNRERVFIIGHPREESGRQIFPLGRDDEKIDKKINTQRMEQTAQCLRARDYSNWGGNFVKELTGNRQGYRVYDSEGISNTLSSQGGGITKDNCIVTPVLTPNRPEKRQNGRRFKDAGDDMFTLTGQDTHGIMIQVHNMQPRSPDRPSLKYSSGGSGHLQRDDISYCLDSGNTNAIEFDNKKIRRLTPKECERLQGFPDDWTKIGIDNDGKEVEVSDSQRYKMLGNAVTVNVITTIIERGR